MVSMCGNFYLVDSSENPIWSRSFNVSVVNPHPIGIILIQKCDDMAPTHPIWG